MSIKTPFVEDVRHCMLDSYSFFVIALLLPCVLPFNLHSQCNVDPLPSDFKIVYNQDDIKFNYWVYYSGNNLGQQYNRNPKDMAIYMNDVDNGSLYVKIGSGIKLKSGAKLIFKGSYVSIDGCGLTKSGNFDEKSFDNKTKGHLCFEFPINRNYKGKITVGFEHVGKNEEILNSPNHSFTIHYNIKDFNSQQEKDHAAAIRLFASDKESGISKMKEYKQTYRRRNCFSSFDKKLEEHALVERIRVLHMDEEKEKCLGLCKEYLQVKYRNGHWKQEIENIKKTLVVRTPQPRHDPQPEPSPQPKKKERWKDKWEELKNENPPCPEPYNEFVEKYPDAEVAVEAQQMAIDRSRMNLQVSMSSNSIKVTGPTGGALFWKDLSVDGKLKHVGASENTVVASFGTEGEYFLQILDECERDTVIRLTNNFSASMTSNELDGIYQIIITGGSPPYKVELENNRTGDLTTVTSKFIENENKVVLPFEYFEIRQMEGVYRAIVTDTDKNEVKATGQFDIELPSFDYLLAIMILFTVVAVGLILYLLLVYIKAKRRKETIYDVEY